MNYTAQDLEQVLPILSAANVDFATSLVIQAKRRGLSEKQQYWVNRLVKEAKEPKETVRINLLKVIDLFGKVAGVLKRPKIQISVDDGYNNPLTIQLAVAGSRSVHPGSITVTSKGRYGENVYYGRILTDGVWKPSAKGLEIKGLETALQDFAEDPARIAADHGKITGSCSFCSRPLSDERSLKVGYGPVCASRFGLRWGE